MKRAAQDRIADAVQSVYERYEEVGVQVCAYHRGELIGDAWAGHIDSGSPRRVDGDTLFWVFCSKAVTGVALHILADRGRVKLGAPICRYWPEFGSHGKDRATVYDVMTHRLGTPTMPVGVTPQLMCDWEWMTSRIADMVPVFEPGTKPAYLAMTFGWVVGELVQRTDPERRPFPQFVREEICDPLGIDDLYFGMPDDCQDRLAGLVDPPPDPPGQSPLAPSALILAAMPPAVATRRAVMMRPDVIRSPMPGTGVIANARSVARFFAMLERGGALDGVRILSEDAVRLIRTPGPPALYDYTYGKPYNVTMGGMHLGAPVGDGERPLSMSPAASDTAFGHPGAGGQLSWADPGTGLAATIIRNRMLRIHAMDRDRNPVRELAAAIFEASRDR